MMDEGMYWDDSMIEMPEKRTRNIADRLQYKTCGNSREEVKLVQSVKNFELLIEEFRSDGGNIEYDLFGERITIEGHFPWGVVPKRRQLQSEDEAALFSWAQNKYGLNSRQDMRDALVIVAHNHKYHPVKDKLNSLKWDGEEHVKKLLPEFLGAEDSEYTYEVMKLWMLGAVTRVFEPGCKFDYMLILHGRQGIGKSTFLQKLALDDDWFIDSLGPLDSKDAKQLLHGSWIVEMAELSDMYGTRGGSDAIKSFLSATKDKFRAPYDKHPRDYLRQNVFAGTTNQADFLIDQTGNRRFWIADVGVNPATKDLFSENAILEIEQAWAEIVSLYKEGKTKLVLPQNIEEEA